jgi:tetratricopeptide (TPR) repeat protein
LRSIGGESPEGFEELARALDGIEDEASLTTLISERPDLFGAEMIAELDDLVAIPGLGVAIAPFLRLLEDAQADPGKAWRRFHAAMDVRAAELAQLSSIFVRGRELADEGNYDEAMELAEAALDEAYDKGHLPWAAEFHMLIAICLRQRGGNVRTELDEAIRHMTRGAEGAAHPYMRAEREMNLAALYGVRRNGDPKQNGEAALAILADALARLDDDAPAGLRVMVLNNLMRGFQTREEDNRLTNLRRSLGYGEEARRLASFSDDPATWAMVRVNLGETTKLLAQLGAALTDDAEAYFRQVAELDRQDELGTLIGVANAAIGEMHLRAARKSAEESGRIGLGVGEAAPPIASERVELDAARRHLELACGLIDPRQEGWHLGAALNHLAEVYLLLVDEEKLELETNRRAVELQTAIAAPGLLLDSASGLGFRHANRGEWAEAAEAFRTALEAGQTNVHARLENAGRRREMGRVGNIARWAALALAKTGELEAAVLTLENGRTQDIRRRLGAGVDEQTLAALPEEARKDWESAITKLSGTRPGVAADAAARELQEVIASIRQVAGFENFDTGSSFAQIAEAAEPGCPLLYANPTPWGTVLLSVSCNAGGWDVGVRFADQLSGEDLQIDLMLRDPEDPVPRLSYFALAAGTDAPPAEERGAVEHAIHLLDPYGKAIAEHLDDLGARAGTLVACGPISLAPLHAAGLEPDGARACLLDHYSVRSAPSATLQGICIARANRTETEHEPTLLALGNPDLEDPELDLAGSQTEVRDLAARFPPQQKYVALRAAGGAEYFADHVEGATYIHLACHASGGLFGYEEAKLHLAGRPVSGEELETMPLSARLTVVSACQTALFDMANLPAEAASIGTAMLIAGSAAVIATQWPVDDVATALLMSRFYEELFDRGASPADALRRSQAWLRDSEPSGRFAHPLFWAPFVLAGA